MSGLADTCALNALINVVLKSLTDEEMVDRAELVDYMAERVTFKISVLN